MLSLDQSHMLTGAKGELRWEGHSASDRRFW
eukprot:COSAG01_NODE_54809_length_329_cov_1.269565_1_plen_30_part_10